MSTLANALYEDHLIATYGEQAWGDARATVDAKVDAAVERLQSVYISDETFVGHSGGKDSVVVNWLAQRAGFNLPVVHTPKTAGPNKVHPLTVSFLYEQSVNQPILFCNLAQLSVLRPELCTQIDGTRIAEHNRTDGRSTCVVIDGKEVPRDQMTWYVEHGLNDTSFIYPIYDWQDIDVWACIYNHNIPFTQEYLVEAQKQ